MDWFVIQVLTGKEDDFRRLARGLTAKSPDIALQIPLRRLPIRRAGKVRIEDKAVFPGYIFVSLPGLVPELIGGFRRIPGFIRWLGNENGPQALVAQDLEILQALLSHGEILGISRVSYTSDMRIQVKDGPLKGLEGRIIKVDKRKQRARVSLDMYRNSFEVDFAFELIAETDKDKPRHE